MIYHTIKGEDAVFNGNPDFKRNASVTEWPLHIAHTISIHKET